VLSTLATASYVFQSCVLSVSATTAIVLCRQFSVDSSLTTCNWPMNTSYDTVWSGIRDSNERMPLQTVL